MSLYKEQTETDTIVTKTFQRSYKATVYNPNKGTPSIRYNEEKVTRVTEDSVTTDTTEGLPDFLEKELTVANSGTTFNLLNPTDGSSLGTTATFADVQVLLYSLYFHLATERDS